MSIISDVVFSSTASLILLCLFGAYLVKIKILNTGNMKMFSNMIEHLLSPCLISSNLLITLNTRDVLSWLPICLFSALTCFSGFFIGSFLSRFFVKDNSLRKIIIIANGLTHTTSIQVLLVHHLGTTFDLIAKQKNLNYEFTSEDRGIYYVMLTTMVNTIMRWSIGKHYLSKDDSSIEEITKEHDNEEESYPMTIFNTGIPANETLLKKLPAMVPKKSFYESFMEFMNPPLWSVLVCLILGCFPFVKNTLLYKGGFLHDTFYMALYRIGKMTPQVIMILLGANLLSADSTGYSSLQPKDIFWCCFIKLIICPLVGIPLIWIWYLTGIDVVHDDPILLFIFIITFATPAAINLLVIAMTYSQSSSSVAKLLLAEYIMFFLFFLPVYLYFFLEKFMS